MAMGLLDRFKNRQKYKELPLKKDVNLPVVPKKVEPTGEIPTAVRKEKSITPKKVKKASAISKVLVRPLVSEKAAHGEAGGKYTFVVTKNANKIEVKKAVKDLYGVMPVRVSVINIEGKRKRFGRIKGKRSDWKKATVTLPKGKTIGIHEGV
jgi:large subunit ribosomal protein L23